jgi:hypothetical protein
MDKITSQRILSEAIRIGDELLKHAETDKDGMSWETMASTGNNDITFSKSESMYTGVAGIALFLLELYRATGDLKYLNASEESMKWVDNSCKKNPIGSYAFITGKMGVSFAMLRMYEVTGRKEYIKKALRIAKKCPNPAAMGADWRITRVLRLVGRAICRAAGRADRGGLAAGASWGRAPARRLRVLPSCRTAGPPYCFIVWKSSDRRRRTTGPRSG